MFGGGNGANAHLMGSQVYALSSHTDVISYYTTSMNTILSTTITGTSMTSIDEY